MKPRIVFFGSSGFVIPIIEVLKKNFNLCLVVTTEKLPTDPVPSYCIKSKVCYYVVTDFRSKKIINKIKEANARIGILASFGAIIPNRVLNLFPKGIINIHPSLLPKYRGPTPVQAAILNSDKVTGVSIIKLDEEVDHGPILVQKKEPIHPSETSESLYERLFKSGAEVLTKAIDDYLGRSLEPKEQNHKKATFTKILTRKDGFIDIQSPPSPQILDRMIRAYYPWPGAWTKVRINDKGLRIKFFPDKKIQVEGKKPVSYKDFINGYPQVATNLKLTKRLQQQEKP